MDTTDLVNKIAQLDVGSLLSAGAQGQGTSQGQTQGPSQQQGQSQAQPQGQSLGLTPSSPSDLNTSNVGANLANQIAAGNRPTVGTGDINTSDIGGNLANQVAGFGTPPATQGQTPGQPQPAPQAQAAEARPSGLGQSQGLKPVGPSDINTSNVAGDLANQLAPGSSTNGQRPASNDIAGDIANQIAGGGAVPVGQGQSAPQGQGQVAAAQSGGAGAAIIGIRSTTIQEANGQQLPTAVVEQQGQGQQPAPPPAPTEAPTMPAPQAPAAPAGPKPMEAPAAMAAPAELQGNSTTTEAAPKSPAQPPAEGVSAMVCTTRSYSRKAN